MRIMRLEGIFAKRREASLGLRASNGVSVGPVGVHWSLALSALIMLAIASALRPTLHQAERGDGAVRIWLRPRRAWPRQRMSRSKRTTS